MALGCTAPDGAPQPATLPQPETSAMQPRVVEKISAARRAVTEKPDSAETWGRFGVVCDAHELLDCAEVCYERAADLDTSDFRWPYLLAFVRERQGADVATIAALYNESVRRSPGYAPAYFRLGEALARQGFHERAGDAYARALELDPRLAVARLGLAQTLLSRGDAQGAIAELEQVLSAGGEDRRLFTTMAQAWQRAGEPERAAEAAARAGDAGRQLPLLDPVRQFVKTQGVSTTHRSGQAKQLMSAGRFAEAIPILHELEQDSPGSKGVLERLGVCYARTGRPDRGIAYLERVIEENPELIGARMILSGILADLGRLDEAIDQLRRGLEPRPADEASQHPEARRLLGQGQAAGAASTLEVAAGSGPLDVSGEYLWGRALEAQGHLDEARAAYLRAARLKRAGG
jgi:tetratricopeptide (TPR) repeat protein